MTPPRNLNPTRRQLKGYRYYDRHRKEILKRYHQIYKHRYRNKRHAYYLRHRDKIIQKSKKWKSINIEHHREWARNYARIKRRTNPKWRQRENDMAKNYRDKHRDRRIKYDQQRQRCLNHQARMILWNSIRNGIIKKPLTCSSCHRQTSLHGHHDDYTKPLQVTWLCKLCHGMRHWKELSSNSKSIA